MTIREFLPSDRAEYLAMAKAFWSSDAVLAPVPDSQLEDTFACAIKKSPYMRGYLIEDEGTAAGYFILTFTWYGEFGGEIVTLDEICIKPDRRGRGLGGRAIRWIVETFRDKKAVHLEVCPKNRRVMSLYESLGFETLDYLQMYRRRDV